MPKSCKELPLQSLTCEQSTCFKFLDGLDELNIIGDFSPESKANLILDNWGETHVDHFGCINQILAIARDGGYVWGQENLPPPPNCTHAVSQLPHCSEFDCQNYISLYREYSEQGRHYSRSRLAGQVWELTNANSYASHDNWADPLQCVAATMDELIRAGLSLVVMVPGAEDDLDSFGMSYAFL